MSASNAFQLTFASVPLAQHEIQAMTLLPPGWQTVTNVQADTDGFVQFSETISAAATSCFFRAESN